MNENKTIETELSQLMIKINKLYTAKQRQENAEMKIRNPYKPLLAVLAKEDDITQLELCQKSGLQGATVSLVSRRMEREGYLVRVVNDHDLRRVHIRITEKGRALAQSVSDLDGNLDSVMFNGFSEEELLSLKALCTKLVNNLTETK